MKIIADTRNIQRMEKDLGFFKKSALPFAVKNTLNSAAFLTRTEAQKEIEKNFINRNRYTKSSVRVDTARSRPFVASVGSVAPYMAKQELGGTDTSRGKHGRPIATSYSSGEGDNARPRKRLPRRSNQVKNLTLSKTRSKGSRKRRNLIAIKQAAATGRKVVFLDLQKTKGFFKVVGGKRKPKIKMLHSLKHRTTRVNKRPWLQPATAKAIRRMPEIYSESLKAQLKRHGLFT